jgi:hypothetical protein
MNQLKLTKIVDTPQPSELPGVEVLQTIRQINQQVRRMGTNRILKETENGRVIHSHELQKCQHCSETSTNCSIIVVNHRDSVYTNVRIGRIWKSIFLKTLLRIAGSRTYCPWSPRSLRILSPRSASAT